MKGIFFVFLLLLALGGGFFYFTYNSTVGDLSKNSTLDATNSNNLGGKKTTLYLEPAREYKSVGETFTIKVLVDTEMEKISGVEFYINYDSDKLLAEKISPGDFFEKPNILFDNVMAKNVNQKNGQIAYAIGTFDPRGGKGTVAEIKFKVIGATNLASLTFDNKTKVAAIGYSDSVLTSAKESQYTLLE